MIPFPIALEKSTTAIRDIGRLIARMGAYIEYPNEINFNSVITTMIDIQNLDYKLEPRRG